VNRITPGPDEENRPIGDKHFVLIDARPDEDLIEFAGLF
jgi:hypothetical protein